MIVPLFGSKKKVHDFVVDGIPWMDAQEVYETIGFWDENEESLVGGVVYHNFTGENIEASIFSTKKSWTNRLVLGVIFWYPFIQLNCARLTALTPADSTARVALDKMGFTVEGRLRKFYPENRDALIYGMLKEECRWLRN